MTANSVSSVVPAVQSTALGVPLFLPKDGSTNKSQLKRPTLTITKNGLAVWKKWLVWWTCRRLAKSEKSSRCTVSLTEETSSVDEVFASRRITSKYNWMLFLIASVLNRTTKFLRSATCSPGTFLWFRLTATCPPLQAISFTSLNPSWWWWRLVVLVRPALSAQDEGWDLFLSPSSCTSSQHPRRVNGGIISPSSKKMYANSLF